METVEKKRYFNESSKGPLYLQLKKESKNAGYKSVNMYCVDIISNRNM